jgi:phosphoribosyl 1,2-cyclic phosphate phosphodiesterase
MEFTVLGSGGNSPTPMPTCDCRVCEEAREKGIPYARRGNSLFVHDENILVDAPELVWESLNRESVRAVDYVFLTHFHADHTLGLRVLQPLGMEDVPVTDFVGDPPTLVVSETTSERVIEGNEVFSHLAEVWSDVEVLDDGETRAFGDLSVTHLTADIHEDGDGAISGFLFEDGTATAFVSPDENRHFDLDRLPDLDLWVKETGYFPETPDGEPLVTQEAAETTLAHEMTFEDSLAQVRTVEPGRVVCTEIEELFRRSYDDYKRLERDHEDLNLEFAYDGMRIEL